MIKKILFVLTGLMLSVNVYANIHLDGKVAGQVMKDHIDKEHINSAIQTYNECLKKSGNWTISPKDLYKVCASAGWDISKNQDKQKCDNFVKVLLTKSTYRYYDVCGNQKGKTGGTEYCITIFKDIEVQQAQAKNLAVEYAKVKYNDDIVCSQQIRTLSLSVGYGVSVADVPYQDYVRCVSKNKNIFYEFEFDDAKESNASSNQFIQRDFGRGLCLIYGGTPELVMGKLGMVSTDKIGTVNVFGKEFKADFTSLCKIKSGCALLNNKLSKWSYTASDDGNNKCVIQYDKSNKSAGINTDYYAKFDGKKLAIFYKGNIIKSWPAVSGRGKNPKDSHPTVCQTPKYQACEDVGPTPSGVYYISQNEIQYFDNITVGNFNSNYFFADKSGTAWGQMRVLLKPDSSTNLYGRKADMYIHGGKYRGSSGCIDLTEKISDFMEWFAKQTDFTSLKVLVDYGVVNEICGEHCTGSSLCTRCECKKEINKETYETNCDYI